MFKFLRRFHCSAQRLREVADDLRWDVVAVDAAVIVGEHPPMLLIGAGGERQTRALAGIDPAGRVERQPQEQSE
jgi:hypothetical protein